MSACLHGMRMTRVEVSSTFYPGSVNAFVAFCLRKPSEAMDH